MVHKVALSTGEVHLLNDEEPAALAAKAKVKRKGSFLPSFMHKKTSKHAAKEQREEGDDPESVAHVQQMGLNAAPPDDDDAILYHHNTSYDGDDRESCDHGDGMPSVNANEERNLRNDSIVEEYDLIGLASSIIATNDSGIQAAPSSMILGLSKANSWIQSIPSIKKDTSFWSAKDTNIRDSPPTTNVVVDVSTNSDNGPTTKNVGIGSAVKDIDHDDDDAPLPRGVEVKASPSLLEKAGNPKRASFVAPDSGLRSSANPTDESSVELRDEIVETASFCIQASPSIIERGDEPTVAPSVDSEGLGFEIEIKPTPNLMPALEVSNEECQPSKPPDACSSLSEKADIPTSINLPAITKHGPAVKRKKKSETHLSHRDKPQQKPKKPAKDVLGFRRKSDGTLQKKEACQKANQNFMGLRATRPNKSEDATLKTTAPHLPTKKKTKDAPKASLKAAQKAPQASLKTSQKAPQASFEKQRKRVSFGGELKNCKERPKKEAFALTNVCEAMFSLPCAIAFGDKDESLGDDYDENTFRSCCEFPLTMMECIKEDVQFNPDESLGNPDDSLFNPDETVSYLSLNSYNVDEDNPQQQTGLEVQENKEGHVLLLDSTRRNTTEVIRRVGKKRKKETVSRSVESNKVETSGTQSKGGELWSAPPTLSATRSAGTFSLFDPSVTDEKPQNQGSPHEPLAPIAERDVETRNSFKWPIFFKDEAEKSGTEQQSNQQVAMSPMELAEYVKESIRIDEGIDNVTKVLHDSAKESGFRGILDGEETALTGDVNDAKPGNGKSRGFFGSFF